MNSIDFPTVITTIYVLVDDWYKQKIQPVISLKPGVKPSMSDSELLTLVLLMDFLPFPGETQFLGFMRANYLEWFPNLLDQSQFNRRLRQMDEMLEKLRRSWVEKLGALSETHLLIDTKPIPIIGLKRFGSAIVISPVMHLLVGVQHVKSAGRRFFRQTSRTMTLSHGC